MSYYLSRDQSGTVVCGCDATASLFASVTEWVLPTCYAIDILGTTYYVTYNSEPSDLIGQFCTVITPDAEWSFNNDDLSLGGKLWLSGPCTPGTHDTSISGFGSLWSVTKSGATYTVTATRDGTGPLLFSGSGPIGAINNTLAAGTCELFIM